MSRPKPGLWKVFSTDKYGRRKFIAVRQKDTNKPQSSKNLEYRGGYTESEESAQHLCNQLNRE